jgi:hypothetical protein
VQLVKFLWQYWAIYSNYVFVYHTCYLVYLYSKAFPSKLRTNLPGNTIECLTNIKERKKKDMENIVVYCMIPEKAALVQKTYMYFFYHPSLFTQNTY